LANDDPKYLWNIADLSVKINGQTLGKTLLLGSDWYGAMDLLDPIVIDGFIKYVK